MHESEPRTTNTPEDEITNQYRKVAGTLSNLFKEIAPRTVYHIWRQDGVGSCKIRTADSEKGIDGSARKKILELRNQQEPKTTPEKCGFHVDGKGCKLTDLRGSYCLEHIDAPWELKKRFGIDGYQLTRDIRWILKTILLAGEPEENEEFTEDSVNAIQMMIHHVQKFPPAGEEEIQKWENPSRFFSLRKNTKK